MSNVSAIAFIYTMPILAIVGYISLNSNLTTSPLATWGMFAISFTLSIFCGIINYIFDNIPSNLLSLILSALNEEFFKLAMLIGFFPLYKYSLDLKKTFFLGASCCLGFAASENIGYILNSNEFNVQPGLLALTRIVMPTPMHFITGGIIAIYCFQFFRNGKSVINIFIGLAIGTVIHSVYNFGASSSSFFMSAAVAIGTIIAFTSYKMFDEKKEDLLDKKKDKLNIYMKRKSKDSSLTDTKNDVKIKFITKKK